MQVSVTPYVPHLAKALSCSSDAYLHVMYLSTSSFKHRPRVFWPPLVLHFFVAPLYLYCWQELLLLLSLRRDGIYDRCLRFHMLLVIVMPFPRLVCFEVLMSYIGLGADCALVFSLCIWVEISRWLVILDIHSINFPTVRMLFGVKSDRYLFVLNDLKIWS